MKKVATSLLVLAAVAARLDAQCDGDAGFTLVTTPEEVEYGGQVEFLVDTPAPALVFWLFSPGEGPFDTPFGPLCVDFPPSLTLSFPVTNSGLRLEMSLPCDESLAGLELFHQFIAVGSVDPNLSGVSNQSHLLVLDCSAHCKVYDDFSDASDLTLNRDASVVDNVLRVTPAVNSQVGTAYYSREIPLSPQTSFTTRFQFRIHGGGDGADGMCFIVQNNGDSAVGGLGGGLGYSGIPASIAVEIDNYANGSDPNANHLGVLIEGDTGSHLATYIPGFDLEDEKSHTLWVEYTASTKTLEVYLSETPTGTRPPDPVMTVTGLDLFGTVGSQAFLGFGAGTGGLNNNHDVENWQFRAGEY